MKKFARNQLARQLIDLRNCGGALLEGVEDFFLQSLRRLHKDDAGWAASRAHRGALSRFLTPEFMRVDANTRFLVPKTFKPP